MHLDEILIEKIHTGIETQRFEDVEGDNNRGWKVDRVDALLDGKKVGYIKVSYIPRDRFKKHFPSIMHYLSKISGMQVIPYQYRDAELKDIPVDVLKKHLVHAAMYIRGYMPHNEQDRLSTLPDDQVWPEYQKLIDEAKTKYGKRFKEFEQYHVDKPLVDYIKVNDDNKRQGIGTALYRAAHNWLKSRGMKLYASGVQTDEAKAAWKKLEQNYHVGTEKVRQGNKTFVRRFFAD